MALDRDTTITYLGHATLLIETPGGKRLLIDPFLARNPACPPEWKQPESLGTLDAILLTHLHNDHVIDLFTVVQDRPDTPVVGIVEATDWIETKGVKNTRGMNKGGSQRVAGIEIIMTHALHSSSFQEEDGRAVYGGEAAGYVLILENGFTLYIAGDTALFGDMALIGELYAPELGVLPIGDHYTMGPKQAAHAIRLLGVRHVVPVHYATFPILTGTPEALAEYASDIEGLNLHALKPGESLR